MGGCGHAQATAQTIGAEVVVNDQVRVRDLPPALQQMLLGLAVGQATPPFGSAERLSVLVMCGRDDPPPATAPNSEQIQQQMEEERVEPPRAALSARSSSRRGGRLSLRRCQSARRLAGRSGGNRS